MSPWRLLIDIVFNTYTLVHRNRSTDGREKTDLEPYNYGYLQALKATPDNASFFWNTNDLCYTEYLDNLEGARIIPIVLGKSKCYS